MLSVLSLVAFLFSSINYVGYYFNCHPPFKDGTEQHKEEATGKQVIGSAVVQVGTSGGEGDLFGVVGANMDVEDEGNDEDDEDQEEGEEDPEALEGVSYQDDK